MRYCVLMRYLLCIEVGIPNSLRPFGDVCENRDTAQLL